MISYFTDGSASPNPGPGGFAVIKNGQPHIIGGEPHGTPVVPDKTTNIRMEAMAIKNALLDSNGEECQITTDSEFWINVLTKWAPTWHANGWRKKAGPIKNLDIVRPLYNLYKRSHAKLVWTRGHAGTELNELADSWANKARKNRVTDAILVSDFLSRQ